MRARLLVRMILLAVFAGGLFSEVDRLAAAQGQESAAPKPSTPSDSKKSVVDAQLPQSAGSLEEILNRMIDREHAEIEAISQYSPIIETYIQQVRPDKELGMVPQSDFYFLSQADFRSRLKVHSLIDSSRKGFMWSFDPAGFLQMIFMDRGEFDKVHYRFKYSRREFLGDVRCYVFDVSPAPKLRGARFVGRIWVEDQDYTIVRINGKYSPAIHFSWRTFEDQYYLHFDSWRTNVKSGMWLPSYVYSQELNRPVRFFGNPLYKSSTHLWGYKLTTASREEELSRLIIESPNPIKEEAAQHDRFPLEAQREWRHEAENNVLDLLERDGLLAPAGPVDGVLNTIVKNLEITNSLDEQIDLHCRVLLTSSLEMFSVGNTIVLSRGLIDVVPDEATMAAMLAHGMADAMLPKPYQDQYGFSDLMRLSPTEVLRCHSFEEEKAETAENSAKATELLKKSPYAAKLVNAGLFLTELRAQAKALKQLISPQIGNEVYFAEELLHSAPALEPANKAQIAALPIGSRLKLDPWSSGVSLMKSRPMSLFSARDKMPFEVTPLVPYLTRYVESSAARPDPSEATSLNQ